MQVDVERWRSKTCQNLQQVEVAGQIGMQLVTPQTSAEGKKSAQSFSC
jgi:hypothetical protein